MVTAELLLLRKAFSVAEKADNSVGGGDVALPRATI